MEPRLRGAPLRDRMNHQIRGMLFKHLADKAAESGLRLVEVNAKGTSALCPRCGSGHAHVGAPDNHKEGRGWAVCRHCSSSLDRDHSASLRIGSKALHDPSSATCPNIRRRRPRNHRLDPEHFARSEAQRKIQTSRRTASSSRQRPLGADSRTSRSKGAVSSAIQPASPLQFARSEAPGNWRDREHCVTRTKPLHGYCLARASVRERPYLTLVSS